MKKLFTALFILSVLSASLFAAEYNYWEITSPDTNFVRYQIADKPEGDWTVMEQKGQPIVYTGIDMTKPIYVAVSYDGVNWSETTVAYPPKGVKKASAGKRVWNQLSVMASPYSLEDIEYEETDDSIVTSYGFGAEVSDLLVTRSGCRFGTEAGFNTYSLPSSYDVDRLSEVFLGFVFGTQDTLGDVVLYMDLDGGVMADILDRTILAYGYFGVKCGVGCQISDSLILHGQVAAKASVQPKGSVSDAYNLIVTPSLGVGYTF